MRDDVSNSLITSIQTLNDGSSTWVTNARTVWTKRTLRSDITDTTPTRGIWWQPTDYRSCHYYSTSWTCDYRGAQLFAPFTKQRRIGQHTWSDWNPSYQTNSVLYGTDSTYRPQTPAKLLFRMEENLRQKLSDQNWNIGQFIGELPETVGFILDNLRTLVEIIKALKKRNIRQLFKLIGKPPGRSANRVRRVVRHAKTLSSAFLAVQYGWKPLLSDIRSAIDLCINGLIVKRRSPTVKSLCEELLPVIPRSTTGTTLSNKWKGKHVVKGEVAYELGNQGLISLDSLGLLDPLSLAWELFPMSFVLDWFIPVGSFIDALTAPWGLTFKYGFRTRFVGWWADFQFCYQNNYISGNPARLTGQLRAMARELYIGFPIPVPYVNGIDSDLKLTFSKTMSVLALLVQKA